MTDKTEPLSLEEIEALLRDATPPPWQISGVSINDGSISIQHEEYRIIIGYVTNAASLGDFIASALKGRTDFGAPDTAKTQWANAKLFASVHRIAATAKHWHRKWIEADQNDKVSREFDGHSLKRAEAAEAEVARLRASLADADVVEVALAAWFGDYDSETVASTGGFLGTSHEEWREHMGRTIDAIAPLLRSKLEVEIRADERERCIKHLERLGKTFPTNLAAEQLRALAPKDGEA